MLQVVLRRVGRFYEGKNGWVLPPTAGLLYSLVFPPFNHETHPALLVFPFLSFLVLLPLFVFSVNARRGRALLHSYLFGVFASVTQYYWIANVVAEGLWHLILLGLCLASLFMGLFYLLTGWGFRIISERMPKMAVGLFPALWVSLEYLRSVGEIAFPWNFLGYALTPLLPLAQLGSLTGVYGLSFMIVAGNVVVWDCLRQTGRPPRGHRWRGAALFTVLIVGVWIWGGLRLRASPQGAKTMKTSLLQTNIDQLHWGNHSLDSAFAVAESMTYAAAREAPELLVLPESALLCYLLRRPHLARRVEAWSDSVKIPLVLGSLHWEPAGGASPYRYSVYNTALFLDTSGVFERYYKIKLVPFSEAMPFEGILPILSRVNLGEADFQRGTEHSLFRLGEGVAAGPLICYEVIFPSFVRKRVRSGASLLVNITNDGWFGRSTAAYHHAAMARMRCIENGVSLARCANSGISMFVDQYGRILGRSGLYERRILTRDLPVAKIPTLYVRWGDWPVGCSLTLILGTLLWVGLSSRAGPRGSLSRRSRADMP